MSEGTASDMNLQYYRHFSHEGKVLCIIFETSSYKVELCLTEPAHYHLFIVTLSLPFCELFNIYERRWGKDQSDKNVSTKNKMFFSFSKTASKRLMGNSVFNCHCYEINKMSLQIHIH